MDSLHQRLENAFDYLYHKGVVHSKAQFGERIGKNRSQMTLAFQDAPKRCTKGLMNAIASAFPDVLNPEYLKTGEGEVGLPDKDLKPHYPATVAAGVLSGDVVQVMDYDVVLEPPIKRLGQYDYMIDVEGSSMEPTYYTGDTVACRKLTDKRELNPGNVYVFVTRDGAVIKRYVSHTLSTVRVSSDNPEFKPYSIDQDSILCVAEVVGVLRNSPNRHSDELWQDYMIKLLDNILVTRGTPGLSEEEKQKIVDQLRGRDWQI